MEGGEEREEAAVRMYSMREKQIEKFKSQCHVLPLMLHIFTFQVQDRPKKENSNRENTRLQEGRLGLKLYCHPHITNYLYRIHVHI